MCKPSRTNTGIHLGQANENACIAVPCLFTLCIGLIGYRLTVRRAHKREETGFTTVGAATLKPLNYGGNVRTWYWNLSLIHI